MQSPEIFAIVAFAPEGNMGAARDPGANPLALDPQ
jgi:hypothetical protein